MYTYITMQSVHLYYTKTFCMGSCDIRKKKIGILYMYMKIKPAQILKTAKMSLLVPAAR